VNTVTDVEAISAGAEHSAALRSDCTVWTWGQNSNGQIGDGTTTIRKVPVEVLNVGNVIMIGSGNYHTAEINADCALWTWGDNSEGQLGNNTIMDSSTAVEVIIPPATPFDMGICVFPDRDNDGIPDGCDNCPDNCNTQQLDADDDGSGDVCDTDPGCDGCGQPQCEQQC
jgi:alpha-tubulin suppressor-like RCC1 family protein